MPRKVIVRLKGGLGNQLFCYAAARRLSLVNDAELVLDTVTGFEYDHLYKRTYSLAGFSISARLATPQERMEPFGRIRRMFERKLSQRKHAPKRFHQMNRLELFCKLYLNQVQRLLQVVVLFYRLQAVKSKFLY